MHVCYWRGHDRVKDRLDMRTSSLSLCHRLTLSDNLFLTQTVHKSVPRWTRRALCNPAGRGMVHSALQDFRSELRSYHSRGEFPEAQQWNRKPATDSLQRANSNPPLHPITHKKRFMLLWDWHVYGFYWEPLFYNNIVTEIDHKTINTDRVRHLADPLFGEFTKNEIKSPFM